MTASQLRAVPICDTQLTHVAYISDEEESRFQLPVSIFGYEQGRHEGGRAFMWGQRDVQLRRGVHLRLVNVGPTGRGGLADGLFGYPVCLVCGQNRSPLSSQTEQPGLRAPPPRAVWPAGRADRLLRGCHRRQPHVPLAAIT